MPKTPNDDKIKDYFATCKKNREATKRWWKKYDPDYAKIRNNQ